jgi:hypothetical protein
MSIFGTNCDVWHCYKRGKRILLGYKEYFLCPDHRKRWEASKEAGEVHRAVVSFLIRLDEENSRKEDKSHGDVGP